MVPYWWLLCYIFAISFQLAGALLLIVRYWFKSVDKQLQSLESRRTHLDLGGEVLNLGETQPSDSEMAEEIWINRLAFAYIAIGYLLGIWGEPRGASKCVITFVVALFVLILVAIGKKISKKESDKFKKV